MNIWVNGVFDILHTGHLDLLCYAKTYGDDYQANTGTNKLIVGIDSDERVKALKGDKRPINGMFDRARMLYELKVVDNVIIYYDDDELRFNIKAFDIDYIIIGDHYRDKEVIGAENAKHGVVYFPTDARSSTDIIEKIKAL